MAELERVWLGDRYDLLTRNCNHFSEKLCEGLGLGAERYFAHKCFWHRNIVCHGVFELDWITHCFLA